MNTFAQRWIGIGTLVFALPFAAAAQQAFTRGALNLRAGPSPSYPVVATLGAGQPMDVAGCTSGYGWCDVALPDGMRGWVYAPSIDYAYEDRRVPLATYGAVIGVPIVAFTLGNYWSSYYRDRSWYGDRRWWGNRAPPPAYGWRPPPHSRPDWRPNPWRPGPGGPGPGFRPRPEYRPSPGPGFRPPRDAGFRPQRPGPGVHAPQGRPQGGGGGQGRGGQNHGGRGGGGGGEGRHGGGGGGGGHHGR